MKLAIRHNKFLLFSDDVSGVYDNELLQYGRLRFSRNSVDCDYLMYRVRLDKIRVIMDYRLSFSGHRDTKIHRKVK